MYKEKTSRKRSMTPRSFMVSSTLETVEVDRLGRVHGTVALEAAPNLASAFFADDHAGTLDRSTAVLCQAKLLLLDQLTGVQRSSCSRTSRLLTMSKFGL
jgi:hypothetical protein